MTSLSETQLREAAQHLMSVSSHLISGIPEPHGSVDTYAREAQNALRAAIESSQSAINIGYTMNRLRKTADGTDLRGGWSAEAQDLLRASILFAGAGVDRSLKRLVEDTMQTLMDFDEEVSSRLIAFAQSDLTDRSGAVDANRLVQLLLDAGADPRERFAKAWVRELVASSAQSSDRVNAIAAALGVTDPVLRKRIAPSKNKSSALDKAFTARNEIAHELDVTKPRAEVRQRLERIRRSRSMTAVLSHCEEMLQVTQLIINDVVARMKAAAA